MSMERIVRPFQNGDVFTARVLVPAQPTTEKKISDDDCTLEWEGENRGNFETTPELELVGFTSDLQEDDNARVTKKVRVENPDDPDQYVVVNRLKQTTFTDEKTGKKYTLSFKDWDDERN
ncbi:hypothetical protein ACJMQP_04180 [Rhodopseudomonas palustris]